MEEETARQDLTPIGLRRAHGGGQRRTEETPAERGTPGHRVPHARGDHRSGHARRGIELRCSVVHLAHRHDGLLPAPLRPADCRTGHHLPGGGRPLRLDEARIRPGAAAVVAVMYWVDNPIWLAGTLSITAMATFSTFFVNLSLGWEYVFGLRLRLGRHRVGHHGPEVRQVGGHHRRAGPRRAHGLLHPHGRDLRH